MKPTLLSINCFNEFKTFPQWWRHIESTVVMPYRDILDIAVYDDGSTDPEMLRYLHKLKAAGRIDWLTLGPRASRGLSFARHAKANAGYAYALTGWPDHEFILHFDTDIWFIDPSPNKPLGFDWLEAMMNHLRERQTVFSTALCGCLWSNGTSYRHDREPSWFQLRWPKDGEWASCRFFSTRMFLARQKQLAEESFSHDALRKKGRRDTVRNGRRSLIGKIDSYERFVTTWTHRNNQTVSILKPVSGVVTRHISPDHMKYFVKRGKILDSMKVERGKVRF